MTYFASIAYPQICPVFFNTASKQKEYWPPVEVPIGHSICKTGCPMKALVVQYIQFDPGETKTGSFRLTSDKLEIFHMNMKRSDQ